jgi:hypothetical protein
MLEVPREQLIRELVESFDEEAMARSYREADGLLVLPRLLPEPLLAEMIAEARTLSKRAVRKRVPFLRKAGAVGHPSIVAEAPALHALHRSPSLMSMFERVTGVPLEHRDPREAHQSALYTYTERGDWMDWHYDECGCPPEDSFSTIIGLVDDSSSRLEIETRRDRPDQEPLRRSIHTLPGTFAFFCGTRAYHRVTPLGEGEERVTFAFTYIRRGKKTGGIYDVRMKVGNALVYFGLGHLFERARTK